MDDKKQKLITALKAERALFIKRGQSELNHDAAIQYLETGKTYSDPNEFELLDAAMHDYDTLCSDYEDYV